MELSLAGQGDSLQCRVDPASAAATGWRRAEGYRACLACRRPWVPVPRRNAASRRRAGLGSSSMHGTERPRPLPAGRGPSLSTRRLPWLGHPRAKDPRSRPAPAPGPRLRRAPAGPAGRAAATSERSVLRRQRGCSRSGRPRASRRPRVCVIRQEFLFSPPQGLEEKTIIRSLGRRQRGCGTGRWRPAGQGTGREAAQCRLAPRSWAPSPPRRAASRGPRCAKPRGACCRAEGLV